MLVILGIPGAGAYMTMLDDESVHEYIAGKARDLYKESHPDSEIEFYFPLYIKQGAWHEDSYDHVFDYSWPTPTMTHFWNADHGPDDMTDTCSVCFMEYENSWTKGQMLWGMAVGEYRIGHKKDAYEYLGHVSHLLADMSVPAHVHMDMHSGGDTYEDWMTESNAELSDAEWDDLLEKGPVNITGDTAERAEHSLYRLFYTQNQVADFFASDDYNGDTIANYDLMIDNYTELGMNDTSIPTPHTMGRIRQYSYLYSIRSVAALYQLFDETVSSGSSLTVVVDTVEELEDHDDGSLHPHYHADYFVEIMINNALYRNEGEQTHDDPLINPKWAFGRDVGLTGSIPIWIVLWDEDDDPNDDDLSDIDPAGGIPLLSRILSFSVDLTTGAISGDITGTCGTPLVSRGYEDDRSKIKFRVLLPHYPTADAGPDQTVDEGDLVTLDGSFTDFNTEDTHTILWHMESSTNGQVVPDSAGDPMDFTPADNGVYTFIYTVTNINGASDSDDVNITVNNVAPVVRAPSILVQPNSDFILPVVHEVDFEGGFSDPGTNDTHTAFWDWGDTTASPGTVDESEGSGNVTGSHTYAVPGEYTITLNVTDDDGGTGDNTTTIHVADTEEALDILNEYIQGLDNSMFKEKASQRKNALDNMFRALDKKLENKVYQGFIQDITNNIRSKADGQVDGKDGNDWITDAEAQQHICMKIDDIVAYVRTFV